MRIQPLYMRIVRLVVLISVGLNIAAMGLGMLRPAHPALTGFNAVCGERLQPCWYGIVPGATTIEEARQLLQWDNTALTEMSSSATLHRKLSSTTGVCMVALETVNNIIAWIKIEYCLDTPVQVGDVIAILGLPERILGARREIGYGGVKTNSFGWWSPFDYTRTVGLLPTSIDPTTVTWRGFIPKWRYCQMEIGTPGC